MSSPIRIAVVGAGLAGLACARALTDPHFEVAIFDKGRSVGGRLSVRRQPPHTFDLGAQYFTVRDERFREWTQAWTEGGVCAPWRGRLVAVGPGGAAPREVAPLERLVGTPDMNAVARHLAAGLAVRTGVRLEHIVRAAGGLRLWGTVAPPGTTLGPAAALAEPGEDLGVYDYVLLCLPAEQAAALLDSLCPVLAETARTVPLEPCVALGIVAGAADDGLRALDFDGAFVGREDQPAASKLSWVARDSSKPGRPPGERWVLHAAAAWSRAAFAAPTEQVNAELLAELARLFGLRPLQPALTTLQRWRYARAPQPLDQGALFDAEARIGIAGDWLAGGRVEGAVLSGFALAERVLGGAYEIARSGASG